MSGPPREFIELLQRHNALGRLLPRGEEELTEALADAGKRAEMQLIINEMTKVKAEIDQFLDTHGVKPPRKR
jgi:hypothetical protein